MMESSTLTHRSTCQDLNFEVSTQHSQGTRCFFSAFSSINVKYRPTSGEGVTFLGSGPESLSGSASPHFKRLTNFLSSIGSTVETNVALIGSQGIGNCVSSLCFLTRVLHCDNGEAQEKMLLAGETRVWGGHRAWRPELKFFKRVPLFIGTPVSSWGVHGDNLAANSPNG